MIIICYTLYLFKVCVLARRRFYKSENMGDTISKGLCLWYKECSILNLLNYWIAVWLIYSDLKTFWKTSCVTTRCDAKSV